MNIDAHIDAVTVTRQMCSQAICNKLPNCFAQLRDVNIYKVVCRIANIVYYKRAARINSNSKIAPA